MFAQTFILPGVVSFLSEERLHNGSETPESPNAKVYYIAEITDADGTVIVDHEAISAACAENSREGLTMLWVICLVYWGLGIGGYCILCHAPEHQRLAGLLIRREFRNF